MLRLHCILLLLAITATMPGVRVQAKEYLRCELTKLLLQKYNFSKTFISNWICMIEHESQRDTKRITTNANQSKSYGLFQINSKDYCAIGRPGGICNKKCEDFINDDISDDVQCAERILNDEGFKYWKGWSTYCRNSQNLPNLNLSCNLQALSKARSKRSIFFKLF